MTAFASCEANADSYTLVWEIRSVNHRYLWCHGNILITKSLVDV